MRWFQRFFRRKGSTSTSLSSSNHSRHPTTEPSKYTVSRSSRTAATNYMTPDEIQQSLREIEEFMRKRPTRNWQTYMAPSTSSESLYASVRENYSNESFHTATESGNGNDDWIEFCDNEDQATVDTTNSTETESSDEDSPSIYSVSSEESSEGVQPNIKSPELASVSFYINYGVLAGGDKRSLRATVEDVRDDELLD
ncbi:hypothetical protein TWF694_002725 [Orbilia ellipsospora]|uniref:Uncharacterized protein n=1 Tax=Orbilia ellipsospora TaxID=2528407 RepID=A0AAV9X441_9PEZI